MTGQCISYDSAVPKTWKWWRSNEFPMVLKPAAPLQPTSKTMKMRTVPCISYDYTANSPTPGHFQNHENENSPMHFLWFWGQPPPSCPLPKPWKWCQFYTFLCWFTKFRFFGLDQIILETVRVQNLCCARCCAVGCAGVVRAFLVTWGIWMRFQLNG